MDLEVPHRIRPQPIYLFWVVAFSEGRQNLYAAALMQLASDFCEWLILFCSYSVHRNKMNVSPEFSA